MSSDGIQTSLVMLSITAEKNVFIEHDRTYRFWNIMSAAGGPFTPAPLLSTVRRYFSWCYTLVHLYKINFFS